MDLHAVTFRRVLAVAVLVVLAPLAVADISDVIFRIDAHNASGNGFYEAHAADLSFNPATGVYSWTAPGPVTIMDGANAIAMLQGANVALVDQPARTPRVNMAWTAIAGMTDTTFTVTSALVSYADINASGKATASLTVTDIDGNGALLTGPQPSVGIYTADYNGMVPGGTLFANILAQVSALPGGSGNISQSDPATGFRLIPSLVHDMSTQAAFILTANDQMAATTGFTIIPEPATLAVLAIALLLRRR